MRPIVAKFAEVMEKRLKENDWKGGWGQCNPAWLLSKAIDKLAFLGITISADPCTASNETIISLAADAANYAMMVVDLEGNLGRDDEEPL